MSIESVERSLALPIAGRIKLGDTLEDANGRPTNLPFFNLKEAPNVEKVYGPEPKELHVRFFSTNKELIAPAFYRWFSGGYVKADNTRAGGTLICQGNGVYADYKDLKTGTKIQRDCLVYDCPDFFKKNGDKQCQPRMGIRVIIPRVDPYEIYEIYTGSIYNINHVQAYLKRYTQIPEFLDMPFKLGRSLEDVSHYDKRSQTQKTRQTYLIKIEFDREFIANYGEEVKQVQSNLSNLLLPKSEVSIMLAPPPERQAPLMIEGQGPSKQDVLQEIANSPEVIPLFDQLSALLGKNHTERTRFLTLKQFEDAADPKSQLVEYLAKRIHELNERTLQDTGTQPTEELHG